MPINYQPQLVTAGFLNHQQYINPCGDCYCGGGGGQIQSITVLDGFLWANSFSTSAAAG